MFNKFNNSQSENFLTVLSTRINSLNSSDKIEATLKNCLTSMHYNAKSKQCAVLDAYDQLCSAENRIEEFEKAVNDPKSPLYKALNIRRHSDLNFFSSSRGSRSLKLIRAECARENEGRPGFQPK